MSSNKTHNPKTMKTKIFNPVFFFAFFLTATQTFSQVSLPAMFSDNMVLQQQTDAAIWGKAPANSDVKIVTSWDKKNHNAKTDATGNWKVAVKTPVAGGPYEITVSEKNTIRLKNVLIGEVWICSGQSNMEMPLAGWGKITNYEKEIAEAKYPNIRLLQIKRAISTYPLNDVVLDTDGWQPSSPETIANFSATAYFFGRDLYQNLNIPIGIIHTSWGGTPAEAWTSAESLGMMPEYAEKVENFRQLPKNVEDQRKVIAQKIDEWNKTVLSKDFGLKSNTAVAAQPNFNDADWQTVSVPGLWENDILPDFDGVVWFRKTIEIPENWEANNLILSLGMIDDNDITYFNGVQVGKTDMYNTERKYTVPAQLVKKGNAVIAVRVTDTGGGGGFYSEPSIMYIAPANKETLRENLNGEWNYKVAVNLKDVGAYPHIASESPHNPTSLYNAMIAPLTPYAVKGAIWYQGESNAEKAYQYRTLFPLMINDWRTKWGYEFPFYFVQLANFMKIKNEPGESAWAELREAQLMTLNLANTGMAVTIDIGDADDIHPKNKQDVGKRLALQAREKTYGQNIVSSGPIYETYQIENGKIRIHFRSGKSKLIAKGGKLKGFSIAGPDKKFHWADAEINGNDVLVSSPDVKFPIAVRYAWAYNPECNLYNDAGLPASPFRTDDFAGTTINNK